LSVALTGLPHIKPQKALPITPAYMV